MEGGRRVAAKIGRYVLTTTRGLNNHVGYFFLRECRGTGESTARSDQRDWQSAQERGFPRQGAIRLAFTGIATDGKSVVQVFTTISLLHPAAHLQQYDTSPFGVFHVRHALVYPCAYWQRRSPRTSEGQSTSSSPSSGFLLCCV